MAPLDWEKIMGADTAKLSDDDTDTFFEDLVNVCIIFMSPPLGMYFYPCLLVRHSFCLSTCLSLVRSKCHF